MKDTLRLVGIPTIVSETERQTDIPNDAISHCRKDSPTDVEYPPEPMDTGQDQRTVEGEDTLKLVDENQTIGETTKAVGTDQAIAESPPIAGYRILMGRNSKEKKTPPLLKGESTEGVIKTIDYTEQLRPGPEESYASFAFRHKRQNSKCSLKRIHLFSQK
jgi:hypothetical protein